jgi:hypothetical protein
MKTRPNAARHRSIYRIHRLFGNAWPLLEASSDDPHNKRSLEWHTRSNDLRSLTSSC